MSLVSDLFEGSTPAASLMPVSQMFAAASDDRASRDALLKKQLSTVPILPPGSVLRPDESPTPQLDTGRFFQDLLKKQGQ